MKHSSPLQRIIRRLDPQYRNRSRVLRKFYTQLGFVNFGVAHQHDDEYDAIRGFSSSLTHVDSNFAVGNFEGFEVRMVDRLDTVRLAGGSSLTQNWLIMEVHLHVRNMPHFFFVPTDASGNHYSRLFSAQPFMQPIDTDFDARRSPEFHGRYQMLARTTRSDDVARLLDSPTLLGLGTRFWPNGIEIEHGRLYIYITDMALSKQELETALQSAAWLAETLIDNQQKYMELK